MLQESLHNAAHFVAMLWQGERELCRYALLPLLDLEAALDGEAGRSLAECRIRIWVLADAEGAHPRSVLATRSGGQVGHSELQRRPQGLRDGHTVDFPSEVIQIRIGRREERVEAE